MWIEHFRRLFTSFVTQNKNLDNVFCSTKLFCGDSELSYKNEFKAMHYFRARRTHVILWRNLLSNILASKPHQSICHLTINLQIFYQQTWHIYSTRKILLSVCLLRWNFWCFYHFNSQIFEFIFFFFFEKDFFLHKFTSFQLSTQHLLSKFETHLHTSRSVNWRSKLQSWKKNISHDVGIHFWAAISLKRKEEE